MPDHGIRLGRPLSEPIARVALRLIVTVYLVLGAMYAVATPPWQAPDEPAHYNYVRYVATYGSLPELRPGDYPADYLEEIKARRFAPELSIDPIRYESHQPPLYYLFASVVYRVAASLDLPLLVTLRAFSVFLGAMALLVAYRLTRALAPASPLLALGATAFAGTLPMHVAMSAAVNNDVLAELLLITIGWRLVAMHADDWSARRAVGIGALLGLAVLTKMQAYVALFMALTALVYDLGYDAGWRPRGGWRRIAGLAGIMLGTALLMAMPWLVRNAYLYGPTDPLGLVRHEQVVFGQLATHEFLAEKGWGALIASFVSTTFRSFWGVFGWMGVPMESRVYLMLGVLCALIVLGLVLWGGRARHRGGALAATSSRGVFPSHSRRGGAIVLAWGLGTLGGYLWWNVGYVQHQGRYLFPALVPIGLAATVGLREVFSRPPRWLWWAIPAGAGTLAITSLATGDVAWFGVGFILVAGAGVWAARWLEARWPGAAVAVTYLAMAGLTTYALQRYIVPFLTP